MTVAKFTDEELKQAINNNPGISNAKLGMMFNVHKSNILSRKNKLAAQGWSPEHDMTHMVPDGFKVKGVSTYYGIDGKPSAQWVKSTIDRERQEEMMQQCIESFESKIPTIAKTTIMNEHELLNHLVAVMPIGDPHIGMRAWKEECGADWDLKIAQETFCKLFNALIEAAPKCHKVVIECLGDLLHSDNLSGTTSRSGHSLDMASSYTQMVDSVILIMRFIVDKCLKHFGTVDLKFAIGNHDDIGSIWISRLFKAAFANEPRVTVDTSPGPCIYWRFGNTLVGIHHGHTIKMPNLPGIMATDRRKDWGDTHFQYWHTGHIHHDSTFSSKEFRTCKVESFRTLAPKDSYATWGGWRSDQDSKCIIIHEKYGEVSRITKNIAEILE